ncbi:MAG: FMN-binding negative transcriptional regulator [Gemmatimonadota bacterium]
MYTPRSFRVDDVAILHALIREHSFGILTSQDGARPVATHLPFMIDPERGGPNGTLIAHMARANPHWKTWTDETQVLAIFQGAHAYVSPGWYESQQTVPTWNYATVHAYGTPRLVHDPDELRAMVSPLVDLHEDYARSGWDRELMEPVMDRELKAIVGFEIPIDSLEGKFKFNQNRSREDQRRVAEQLQRSADPLERASAEIMRRNLAG